jgi:hypothetical protein
MCNWEPVECLQTVSNHRDVDRRMYVAMTEDQHMLVLEELHCTGHKPYNNI